MTTVAEVRLWGKTVGAVAVENANDTAVFEYDPGFAGSGIQIAPLTMPTSQRIYSFPALSRTSFHGLPGLLADSLPDKFGSALIEEWLVRQGRNPASFNSVERLCYTGKRGMGALEFYPGIGERSRVASPLDIAKLTELASDILMRRDSFSVSISQSESTRAMADLLKVGTSAGGARAKAVIAWNPETNEVRSGQVDAPDGFEHWLLKLDGVANNSDRELSDPQGFGAIEFAYCQMARAAGIEMSECRLLEEGGRRHFMTRRFDRTQTGKKCHMQSLGALAHFDFNLAGAYSYEQALQVVRQIGAPTTDVEALFRRMVFNIVARNQDDHVKNIAFLMDKSGNWRLAPAFDVCFSYNPDGNWTSTHQMSLNGKRDNFLFEDFKQCEKGASLKQNTAKRILAEVVDAVSGWTAHAEAANIRSDWRGHIQSAFRLKF
ncbi:MAG: type II toxin-antitoxin system HipA family toxin [Deltaproteobacteria bacterium]|nr:type II toxin-antitoxin system HipA family toxin [Deltaproteobacteria bacterium]